MSHRYTNGYAMEEMSRILHIAHIPRS